METTVLQLETAASPVVVDLTSRLTEFVSGRGDGILSVFVPHATAGVAIIETGAGSDTDLLNHLETLFPRDNRWLHRHGSPGHGVDHVLPAFISPSMTIPVIGGSLALGTWQSVCLVDPNGDNRTRRVRLSFLSG